MFKKFSIFIVVLFLSVGIFVFFKNKNITENKAVIKTITKQETSLQFIQNKLPLPKGVLDSKIVGTLTYNHAIKIARNKFAIKDYNGALIWAYRADKIAPYDRDAWLLYIQSLYKLGDKKQAYGLLQYYRDFHFKK